LVVQYWFFWYFNQFNDLHEGDWEGMQIAFEASDPQSALEEGPSEVVLYQHAGGEKASWEAGKVEKDGTHPVVYPAAGSHANFFDDALYLGRSAEQGVGCDDTTGPSTELRPNVRTIPSDPTVATERFPWIAFEGRWGERQRAIYNGPTGPNLKSQWTDPITWAEGWRDRSYAIPAGGYLGSGATDFFCEAVESGSMLLVKLTNEPGLVLALLAALTALVVLLAIRATWTPTAPLRVARRRSWGQVLTAAARMYASRPFLFVGIGLVTLPVSIVISLLQAGIVRLSQTGGSGGEAGGLRLALAFWIGTVLTLGGLALVQAASARAIVELDAGRPISPLGAFRAVLDDIGALVGALAVAVAVVSLLWITVVLIPIAIWLIVRWALLVPAVELEHRSALGALHRSASLVRRQWLKVGTLVVVAAVVAIVAGPLVGAVLILLVDLPFELVNVLASLLYAVAMPFVAITTAYVYFDSLAREHVEEASPAPHELPAEVTLPA